MFNQRHLVCDWWYNIDCQESATLYTLSNDYDNDEMAPEIEFDLSLAQSGAGNPNPGKEQKNDAKSIRDRNKQ